MRENGWHRPFDILQITTWFIFPLLLAGYYGFVIPYFSLVPAILLAGVHGGLSLIVLYNTVKSTSINPVDDQFTANDEISTADSVYCHVCQKYVEHDSRHCRVCDKCVAKFDHHCKWLNNCIGRKNYKYFLGAVASTALMSMVHVGCSIYIVTHIWVNEKNSNARLAIAYGSAYGSKNDALYIGRYIVFGIQVAYLLLLIPTIYLLTHLIYFHMKLHYERLTTYDFIIRARNIRLHELQHPEEKKKKQKLPCLPVLCCEQIPLDTLSLSMDHSPKSISPDGNKAGLLQRPQDITTPKRGFGAQFHRNTPPHVEVQDDHQLNIDFQTIQSP